jgi:hypothetical protein
MNEFWGKSSTRPNGNASMNELINHLDHNHIWMTFTTGVVQTSIVVF